MQRLVISGKMCDMEFTVVLTDNEAMHKRLEDFILSRFMLEAP